MHGLLAAGSCGTAGWESGHHQQEGARTARAGVSSLLRRFSGFGVWGGGEHTDIYPVAPWQPRIQSPETGRIHALFCRFREECSSSCSSSVGTPQTFAAIMGSHMLTHSIISRWSMQVYYSDLILQSFIASHLQTPICSKLLTCTHMGKCQNRGTRTWWCPLLQAQR